MKYWKKKIKNEFNVYIKRIKLTNQYGNGESCYITYETIENGDFDVKEKIFKNPRDIWLYLNQQEMLKAIIKYVPVKPLKESDEREVKSLKDFKK